MKQKKKAPIPTAKSERVVVDEIFADDSARLLRAKRKEGYSPDDFSIDTWGNEREYAMHSELVEAFVGFKDGRHLVEGDVFFIVDDSKLHDKYKPIPRDTAREIHLLKPWDESRNLARKEIKKQYAMLSARPVLTGRKRDAKALLNKLKKKFKIDFF